MSDAEGLKILVVDDSPHVRKVISSLLGEFLKPVQIDTAGNGQLALARMTRDNYDLVILDLSMPVMDGYTFLRIFRTRSKAPVLVVSALKDLEHVEQALELGATGFLPKPTDVFTGMEQIREEFRLKISQLLRKKPEVVKKADKKPEPKVAAAPRTTPRPLVWASETKEDFPIVVIGSSSGGPPTLQYLLSGLPADMKGAVLIAQHMPEGFTYGLVDRLDRIMRVKVREAENGEVIRPGEVLFCPGGHHMTLRKDINRYVVCITKAPAGSCAPSVDTLFASAAKELGRRVLGVILTGMGRDGSEGVQQIKAAGGMVIAESEETALIFGMPKQAAATGCVDGVLPLPGIAVELLKRLAPNNE